MGIIAKGTSWKNSCGSKNPKKFFASIAVTVPGKVMNWVKDFKYPEIKECLRPKKPV